MIHFDFKVDDLDAENIFSAMSDSIQKCSDEITKRKMDLYEVIGEDDKEIIDRVNLEIEWFEKRIIYLKDLTSKMKNTWVEK